MDTDTEINMDTDMDTETDEQVFIKSPHLEIKKPRREKGLELHFRCSDCAPLVVPVLLHVLTRAMGPNARALERLH